MPREAFTPTVTIKYADYYKSFACKCGDCRDTCCHGWKITVTYDEYMRLDSLRADPSMESEISKLLEVLETPEHGMYAILRKNEKGSCHMLDRNGLCSLHKKYGADFLPSVCKLYPRSVKMGSCAELVCSAGCEKVCELLISSPEPFRIITVQKDYNGVIPECYKNAEERDALREQAISAISDRSLSFEKRFDKLALLLPGGKGLSDHGNKTVAELSKRIILLFCETSPAIGKYGRKAMEYLSDGNGNVDMAKYENAEKLASNALPHLEQYFEKLLVNHMVYEQYPYTFEEKGEKESGNALFAVYALVRFLTVAAVAESTQITPASKEAAEKAFVDAASAAYRFTEHTDFYRNANIIINSHLSS